MKDRRVHVTGLGFPEGPVALPDGSIAFVDLLHRKIRAFRDGTTREICTVAGAPNGMRLGPDGALWVANNGGIAPDGKGSLAFAAPQISGRIQRIDADGSCRDVAVGDDAVPLWRPNDLVFSRSGDIVFTDPQNWEALEQPGTRSDYLGGQLMLATSGGSLRRLARMTGFPNGLAFHPDGSLLVGITAEHRIVRFPWHGDAVGAMTEWCLFDAGFGPDGMAFVGDRLFVTGSVGDRIAILDLAGDLIEMVVTGPGSDPTNLCAQGDTLWVTMGLAGELVSYRL
ncbi:MAG TPA: SMP-30/gluconolactonase/LRE family protein [Acetobacteraceae bacterium]|nr:SMP-30/gluconolactonase/LRE family protein [Acetobacteraceae bacterium]